MCERLNEAGMIVREGSSVNDMFSVFQDVIAVAAEVAGCREHKSRKKRNAWLTDEIKEAIGGMKRGYKKMLQRRWLGR